MSLGQERNKLKSLYIRLKSNPLLSLLFCVTVTSIIWWLVLSPRDFWADEYFTSVLINNDLKTVFVESAKDMHPPLYNVMARLFTYAFGYNLITLRLFSFMAYIGMLAVAFFPVRKLTNTKHALLFAFVYTFIPVMIAFVLEIRMYTWANLFVTLCVVYAYKFFISDENKDAAIMCISGIAAAYTHYYALIAVAATYFAILCYSGIHKKKIKRVIVCIAVSIATYIPWLYAVIMQMNRFFTMTYIEHVKLSDFITAPAFFFFVGTNGRNFHPIYVLFTLPLIACAAYLLLLGCYKTIKGKTELTLASLCIFVFLITILFFFIFSITVKPLFATRYMMCMLGLLCIFIADAMDSLKHKKLLSVILCVFVASSFANLYIRDKTYGGTQITDTFNYIADVSDRDTLWIVSNNATRLVQYYLPEATILDELPDKQDAPNRGWLLSYSKNEGDGTAWAADVLERNENVFVKTDEILIYSNFNNNYLYAAQVEKAK